MGRFFSQWPSRPDFQDNDRVLQHRGAGVGAGGAWTWATIKAALQTYFNSFYAASAHGHADASAGVAGFMAGADKSKLDGVAVGATANDTDANLKSRANHTGEQAMSTVTGLDTALAAKQKKISKGPVAPVNPADTDEWIDTTTGIKYTWIDDGITQQWVELNGAGILASQAEMEAGTEVEPRKVSPKLVKDAIVALASGSASFTAGMRMLWPRALVGSIPAGWQECDGTNGTPDEADVGTSLVMQKVNPAAPAPTITSWTIGTDGLTHTLVFSESVSVGAGGSAGFVAHMSGGDVTLSSPVGAPGASVAFTGSRTVLQTETETGLKGQYTQPGNGIEATTGGVDVASCENETVTNSSTQVGGGGPTLIAEDNFDSYVHNGDLATASGGLWVDSGPSGVSINKPAGDASAYTGASQGWCRRTDAAFTANQRAEATIDNVGSSFQFMGVLVRGQTGGMRYQFQVDGAIYYLIDFVAEVQHIIPGHSGVALVLAAGDKIALEVTGEGSATRLKIQKDVGAGWVDIASNIDPGVDHYIDGGKPGVGGGGSAIGGTRVDDWRGYNV
jgi:hypothetical protein